MKVLKCEQERLWSILEKADADAASVTMTDAEAVALVGLLGKYVMDREVGADDLRQEFKRRGSVEADGGRPAEPEPCGEFARAIRAVRVAVENGWEAESIARRIREDNRWRGRSGRKYTGLGATTVAGLVRGKWIWCSASGAYRPPLVARKLRLISDILGSSGLSAPSVSTERRDGGINGKEVEA